MTSLAHAAPAIRRADRPGSHTALLAASRLAASIGLVLVVGLVVLGLIVLAISSIDAAGRLPHPQPLPAPSAPSVSGS